MVKTTIRRPSVTKVSTIYPAKEEVYVSKIREKSPIRSRVYKTSRRSIRKSPKVT